MSRHEHLVSSITSHSAYTGALSLRVVAAALVMGAALCPPAIAEAGPDPFPGVTFIPVTAQQAYQIKREFRERVLFVDVRSRLAAAYTGMPVGIDAHIPFTEPAPGYRWSQASNRYEVENNLAFENDFNAALAERKLAFTDPVLVIGTDGVEARQVSERLAEIGYTQIFVVQDGFDAPSPVRNATAGTGWKQAGLPWTAATTAVLYRAK